MNESGTTENPIEQPAAPETTRVEWSEDQVRDVLRTVVDPELHINIVDLGLVYQVTVHGPTIDVHMTLTSPGCPYGPYLLHQVKDTLLQLKGIDEASVLVVWEPPWGPDKMSEEARLELGFDV
ncbi:MAG TPA: metal-sulfur cluster assembly factor [Kiritimatiellia bacterium]|nr:metal-sulfur cluster assembly factor [Kiritimatiellia bacterium]HMP00215.1 metal-sulfur cluster assembly factor [Kiritimatiellia bacterium]HMP96845.1 metal-sulfur cluster assembly factor [Kiritimatiellia bacterium]